MVVRDGDERVVARGEGLERTGEALPMTRLSIAESEVAREDRFPTEGDLGEVVLLAGGEAGILLAWWNAADGNEWRWRLEFYNRR